MASNSGAPLTGVCFIASFVWLLYSLQRHSLIDQPRLSSFLLLLISGLSAFAVSIFSKWLPGADGRFDSDAVLKTSSSSLPPRPRRFYVPCIIILISLRLEILHRVLHDFQCSTPGVESFLPLVLMVHRFFSHRPQIPVSDEPEAMWGSLREDLMSSPVTLIIGPTLLSYGAYAASNLAMGSTYFCSSVTDQRPLVVFLQVAGIFVDAAILVLLWRVLSWARTTRSRLRTLGGILLVASFATCIPSLALRSSQPGEIFGHPSLRGVNPLYIFDTLSTSIVVATLVISASLMACDTSPLEPTTLATITSGILTAVNNTLLVGTYQQTTPGQPLLVLATIFIGFTIFAYTNNMRSIVIMRRVLFLLLLLSILLASVLYTALIPKAFIHHPVDELVYKNRIEADRWLRHATVSTTLKLAVQEYEERHHGRKPPRNFDKWFKFAQDKRSVVIDRFDQMENDILPFWGLQPQDIRDGLEFLKGQPNIGIISIANGKASSTGLVNPSQQAILNEVVALASAFAQHLPAMEIAINLQERPRVMIPWNEVNQLRTTATQSGFRLIGNRLSKRDNSDLPPEEILRASEQYRPVNLAQPVPAQPASIQSTPTQPHISAQQFRQIQILACPPGSASRSGVNWDVRDFCGSCISPHSTHQFLRDWQKALDPCHQPDIFNLHEFHTTPHQFELYQRLLPLFSGSKTVGFNDILIPFSRSAPKQVYDETNFSQKQDIILWESDVHDIPRATHESLHGSHRLRLVHLAQNSTDTDRIPMLLGFGGGKDSRFRYESVPITEASSILSLHVALTGPPEGCQNAHCERMRDEFGLQPPATDVNSRYMLLLDSRDGPSPNLLQVLRSNSVPVVSSIFQQWFTERLMPWVHFIPIDTRYHALHSTLAYFIGLDGRGTLNGRKQVVPARTEDAKWIAQQGRKWAEKTMRKEDMEVYLFRLLLEWGRVIDDNRDEMGYEFKG